MKRKASNSLYLTNKYAKLAAGAYHTGRAVYDNYKHIPKILRDIAGKTGQRAKSRMSASRSGTTTKTKRQSGSAGMSTGPGRSGGFLKTRKKVSKKSNKLSNGYCISAEYGGIGTSANVGVVGHCSVSLSALGRCVWGSVLKKLLESCGFDFDKTSSAFVGFYAADTITVTWQGHEATTVSQEVYTAVGGESLEDLVDYFNDQARPYVQDNAVGDQVRFVNIFYEPSAEAGGNPRRGSSQLLRLEDCFITFKSDCNLKIQNRTVVSAGDDEVDVNNQPLFGKGYSGMGTGAEWRDVYPGSFVAHQTYGLITGDDGTITALEDVQDPNSFKGVTRTGKMKLEPGEIKTSTLVTSMRRSFNDCIVATYPTGNAITSLIRRKIGKYRFFIYEKMLDTGAEYNIVLAFEHAMNSSAMCSERKKKIATVKEFTQVKNLTF